MPPNCVTYKGPQDAQTRAWVRTIFVTSRTVSGLVSVDGSRAASAVTRAQASLGSVIKRRNNSGRCCPTLGCPPLSDNNVAVAS